MFVKICGITNEEDALLSVAMGADALGFIFAAGSTRLMSGEHVRDIVKRIPQGIATFGVFRNERPERVVEIVQRCGLSGAQLHGHEPLTEVQWIRARLPYVIQAFSAHDRGIADAVSGPADVVLIDSPAPGTGQVFDWSLAEGMPGGLRLMLAGGLNPENIADAIAQVRPWGVDVATGVESAPGMKDARKLRRFIVTAKEAGDALLTMPQNAETLRPYDWELDGEGNPGQSRDPERQGPPSLRIV
jgi:phosphoribosylanthranilate isomerase